MMPLLANAAADVPVAGGSISTGQALLLVGTIAVLLAVFVLGVLLLTRSRQWRSPPGGGQSTELSPDAWEEAGRRIGREGSEAEGQGSGVEEDE